MPKLKDNQVPAYRLHKQSGQAIVTLDGRDILLGRHGTAASRTEYQRLTSEWLANGRRTPAGRSDLAVTEVIAAFWKHAQRYYVDAAGKPSGEAENFRHALRILKRLYGHTPASTFGPLALKAVHDEMIVPKLPPEAGRPQRSGWSRRNANGQVRRLKHVFKWAAEHELVAASIYHALQTVAGLRAGKSEARETAPVKPVAEHALAETLPHLSRTIRAMVELQLFTGMRPGELVAMRPCDIEMSDQLWVYRPAVHKTLHYGHTREIPLGPRAREALQPFLTTDLHACVFSPARAVAEAHAARAVARRTPMSCGNKPGSNRQMKPRKQPGTSYTVASYRQAIANACDAAFALPPELAPATGETWRAWRTRLTPKQRRAVAAWRGEHRWHPHQLRHNAATRLRRDYGIEATRMVLGHRSAVVTELYAEIDRAKVEAIMSAVG